MYRTACPPFDRADTERLIAAIPLGKFERIYLVFNAPVNDGGGFCRLPARASLVNPQQVLPGSEITVEAQALRDLVA